MGPDNDDLYCGERTDRGRKPSLQSRLQSGMNLQICFMNDTGSDSESPNTDTDSVDSQLAFVENDIPAAPHNKVTWRFSLLLSMFKFIFAEHAGPISWRPSSITSTFDITIEEKHRSTNRV